MAAYQKSFRTGTGASIERLLLQFGENAVASLKKELYAEGEGIMAQSKEIVPVDTGALRASGYVAPPERDGDIVRVELGYGGAAAPYAVIVHEDLEANHPRGGTAKYLEIPFNEAKNGIGTRIARGMRADLTSQRVPLEPQPQNAGVAQAENALEQQASTLPE